MVHRVQLLIVLMAAAFVGWGCAASSGGRGAAVNTGPTTIILVRHAEKADGSRDPDLSEAGRARAGRLSTALRDAGVDTVYYSDRKRTKETAERAMAGWGVKPAVIREYPATTKAAELAVMLRGEGRVILFVGHSNVIGELLGSLGGWAQPEMTEAEYDHMFVVTLRDGAGVGLIRAGFGPE